MAMVLAEEIKGVNSAHAIQICLVHDLAEYITGDIDSYRIILGEVTKEEKQKGEEMAMQSIKDKVSGIGEKLYDLWKEYEEAKTPEAKYAKALDKIEALVYLLKIGYIAERADKAADLVATYANSAVEEFPQLKPILDIVKTKLKKEFEKNGFEWKEGYN
jgi:5'-deoxynucleotidase YfbR-like HD superfamily hydrolase